MPRIQIVTEKGEKVVTMDEHLPTGILDDEHQAVQVLERLAWALQDAERAERRRRKARARARARTLQIAPQAHTACRGD